MELRVRTADRTVYLDTPVTPSGPTIDVTIWEDGQLVYTANTVTVDPAVPGRYSTIVPYHLVDRERNLIVRWEFDYTEDGTTYHFSQEVPINVVTPYVSTQDVQNILGTNSTVEEARDIEADVRYIINAHCGQSFGNYTGVKKIRGSAEKALLLPERLYELNSIQQEDATYKLYDATTSLGKYFFELAGDGWYIKTNNYAPDGIKTDSGYWSVNGPIFDPFTSRVLGANQTLLIDGSWGYPAVPPAVTEAAKLLINDYACNENIYRDRYLTNVSTTDWRLVFSDGTFARTGNSRADLLLDPFVLKRGWAVL